jgi:hypothetical protein
MTGIPPDRTTYALERRYSSKKGGKPLKGFALDLTIRFNSTGTAFVQNHNGDRGPMPFNTLEELKQFVSDEIDRNYGEHFAAAAHP